MAQRDYASILFTPEQIGNQTAEYLRFRRENKGLGVQLGLSILDNENKDGELLLPLMPGELMGIIARPGNGKTGFMVRWARERSKLLKARRIADRAIVYVTLEQSIEELNAFNLAAERSMSITQMAKGEISDDDWKACLQEGINRRFLPLWNIGYSSTTENKQLRVDVDAVEGALELIRSEHKLQIDIIFVDYLQRIPYDRAESKTVGVSDNLDALKTMALKLRAPMVVGVQAQREVDELKEQIPGLENGQWTSNIEQTCDRVLSLVRPKNYRQEGEFFGSILVRGHAQMLVSVLKQKLGPANFAKWVYFDPIYNHLDLLENKAAAQRGGIA